MKSYLFAFALLVSLSVFVVGVALVSAPAAWMVGGVGLAVWSFYVLTDPAEPAPAVEGDE